MKALKETKSLKSLLSRLWFHLSGRRKHQFVLLIILTLFSAVAEIVSLGAILPFIGILTVPEKVFSYPFVSEFVGLIGINSASQLVLPLTIAFSVAAILAGCFRLIVLWVTTRLAFATGADLSMEVYRRTLYQPYSVHVSRNSSEVISGITTKVNAVVFGLLLPLLTLISTMVLLVAITGALITIDPKVAIISSLGFGATYAIITKLSRRRLFLNGKRISEEQNHVFRSLQEGLGGIRDVLIDGTQPVYCEVYRKADIPMRWAEGINYFIALCPRYVMEAIGMVLIATLAYSFSFTEGGVSAALPLLGALAFGAQRLLPTLQQAYGAWAYVASSHSRLADIIELLDQPLPPELLEPKPSPLIFKNFIHFNHVRFRYDVNTPWVLNDLDFKIPKGSRVGFVGTTGSGKSTTLDLLMGLLSPSEGDINVDGIAISGKTLRAWQRNIAHVPQSIFLADATVAENIAFGVPKSEIDMHRVQLAAKQAQISDFIEKNPNGYDAEVGERGVRLSGGQRQRIGIARALYKQANVLVLDEATSSLDNATEQSLMDAIELLDPDLTIFFIAHRLTTVQRCDIIIELRDGRVEASGTYESLLEQSTSFRQLALTQRNK